MPLAIAAYGAAALALAAAAYVHAEFVAALGFPDGFVSELAAAEKALATWFVLASLAFAGAAAVLGARRRRGLNRVAVLAAMALYGAVVAGLAALDHHARSTMMGSGGG